MGWSGNKRQEVEKIYDLLDFTNITTIVEPFCGSCAISYYISLKQKNLTYILNDNNKYLKEMYDIIIVNDLLLNFEKTINDLIDTIKNKDDYLKIIKKDDLIGWFIKNKYYKIRPGLYDPDNKFKHIDMKSFPIVDFFKNNKILFLCYNGLEIYSRYKDDKQSIIIMDPPYIVNSCNSMYTNPDLNIYEYLCNNDIKYQDSHIYLILEDIWMIRLLFKGNKFLFSYKKQYEQSKKKTTHIIISN